MLRFMGMAAALVMASQAAAAPVPPTPSGPWQVEFADQRCVASRPYTTASGPMVLGVEPSPDGEGVRFLVRVEAAAKESLGFAPGKLVVNGRQVADRVLFWRGGNNGLIAFAEGDKDADPQNLVRLREVRTVALQTKRLSADLALTGTEKLAGVLATCNRGLLESWGFAAAEQDRLASWPKMEGRLPITFNDYPASAIKNGESGEVRTRLTVGADGRVTQCALRSGSGFAVLDNATCALLQRRARFTPARDKEGKPMAAPAFQTVIWMVPGN